MDNSFTVKNTILNEIRMTLKLVCRYVNVGHCSRSCRANLSPSTSPSRTFLCAGFDMRAIFRFCMCDKIIIYHKSRVRQKSLGSFCGNGTSNYITSKYHERMSGRRGFSLLSAPPPHASPRSPSRIM